MHKFKYLVMPWWYLYFPTNTNKYLTPKPDINTHDYDFAGRAPLPPVAANRIPHWDHSAAATGTTCMTRTSATILGNGTSTSHNRGVTCVKILYSSFIPQEQCIFVFVTNWITTLIKSGHWNDWPTPYASSWIIQIMMNSIKLVSQVCHI